MPKTDAERQRERRARIKEDPERFYLYKAADSLRKQRKRLQLSSDQLKCLRNKTKLSTRIWREKNTQNERQESEETNGNNTPYQTLAAFTKARNRVEKYLPANPNKRSAVVTELASKYARVDGRKTPRTSGFGLQVHIRDAAKEFYENDCISRVAPGMADVISVRNEDGSKSRPTHQKRHMTMTIAEAFELFKREHPDYKLGKSSFAELRPKYVLLVSQMPHNVCGCKYHNNVILLLESLHRKLSSIVPLYTKTDFLPLCVCDMFSEECMSDNCTNCSNGQKFENSIVNQIDCKEDHITWQQWGDEDGYLIKRQMAGTVGEAVGLLKSQLPKFLWHVFIKEKQQSAYDNDKADAKMPESTLCMMQMDFAENYTATFQDEIQSSHWRQRQITIYTIMLWCRDFTKSYIIVSDVREHEKKAVAAYTSTALGEIKKEFPFVNKVNIWTDGPSSQYKNRYIFSLIPKLEDEFQLGIILNFSATSHGKGPNDALGGNAKRIVRRQVLSRKFNVFDANSFAAAIKDASQQIAVNVLNQEDIDRICDDMQAQELWRTTKIIPGTINFHYVASYANGTLTCKFYKSATECSIRPIHSGTEEIRKPTEDAQGLQALSGTNTSDDESDDIPLTQMTQATKYPCGSCSWLFADKNDPKLNDDWIRCSGSCKRWFHETCAENYGVIDDFDSFICSGCLKHGLRDFKTSIIKFGNNHDTE